VGEGTAQPVPGTTHPATCEKGLPHPQNILESIKDYAIFTLDPSGVVTSWNPGAKSTFGYAASEIEGRDGVTLWTPEDQARGGPAEERALALRDGMAADKRWHVRKDGLLFFASGTMRPLRDEMGNLVGFTKVCRDATAEHEAQAALTEARAQIAAALESERARLAEIFHRSSSFMAVFRGPEHVFELVNDQYYALVGQRELIGKPVRDALPEIAGQGFFELLDRVFHSGEPFVGKGARILVQPGADQVLTERHLDFVYQPMRDSEGAISGIFAHGVDITEREKAEIASQRLAAIVESSDDAIISKDLRSIITSWNAGAQRIFGYTAPEMIGRSIHVLIPEERRGEEDEILSRISRGERVDHLETVRVARDGRRLDISVTISPIRDSSGKVIGASKVARDITERKLTEARLLESERSARARAEDLSRADRNKDEFLAMLAHELRNPLAPLRNAAEVLQTEEATAEERTQAQRIISRQIESMSRMIDDLLDVARITEGKIELRKQPVALEAILTAATSLVRSDFAARHQDLAVSLPASPVFLHADATRLEQVFVNLLSNACKYSDEGCHISVSAERAVGVEPPEVIVRVRDDGDGIDPELMPRIFDLFVQARRTLDRSHGGLGIGLTLVGRLVKLHGGSVEAHSGGLGHGSEFVVHLPILHQAPAPAPEAPIKGRGVREPSRRMLIVDDNEDSARSMSTLQRLRGHETRTAFTGPDAVAVAAEFAPEVVLLDIGLPGMDGYEVARRLRAMPALGGAFLVAMTGYRSDEDRAHAKEAGFDEYLVKPVDHDQLRKWLRSRT
jgi:PAS domain S-box-containing protein